MSYTVERVNHIYDERSVLRVEALQVPAGEILALVGPSGAGKSTLLRLLAMLEAPTQGSVTVTLDDATYTDDTLSIAARRQMTMVFQRPVLLSRSVRDNIAYGLALRGERDDEAVSKMLKRVRLLQVADARSDTLSGGEMQRVSIARALVLQPQILLLDEPTANLDPYNIRIIEDLLRAQHARHQTTILMVTHNIFQARRLADRVALLYDGDLIEVAPTEQFFEQPQDPRTAAFIKGDLVY